MIGLLTLSLVALVAIRLAISGRFLPSKRSLVLVDEHQANKNARPLSSAVLSKEPM